MDYFLTAYPYFCDSEHKKKPEQKSMLFKTYTLISG